MWLPSCLHCCGGNSMQIHECISPVKGTARCHIPPHAPCAILGVLLQCYCSCISGSQEGTSTDALALYMQHCRWPNCHDSVAEWLRRRTRNPLGISRPGSSPGTVGCFWPDTQGDGLLASVSAVCFLALLC